jgi:hypothetical protein
LNALGGELNQLPTAPVTLPRISLPPDDDQTIWEKAAAATARIAERRTIRAGLDAWQSINRAESF